MSLKSNAKILLAQFNYPNKTFAAGSSISDIDFELNNSDWSVYNWNDDPSAVLPLNVGQYQSNTGIAIYNSNNQLIYGIEPTLGSVAQNGTSQNNQSTVTATQCSSALTTVATAKCGSTLKFNNKLYECVSSAEDCGNTQSTGVYCSTMNPDYPQWGAMAWKELGVCPAP